MRLMFKKKMKDFKKIVKKLNGTNLNFNQLFTGEKFLKLILKQLNLILSKNLYN